MDNLTNYWQR